MTRHSLLPNFALSVLLILMILTAAPFLSRAENPPDSLNSIQSLLPDSINLKDKVVYVDFWASWCGPCRYSFPWMKEMYDRYHSEGFEIVAVNVDKDHDAAMKFLENNGADFPIIYDSTGNLAKQYGLEAMPTSFVYDRSGHLVSQHLGFRQEEADSLNYAILKLVSSGSSK